MGFVVFVSNAWVPFALKKKELLHCELKLCVCVYVQLELLQLEKDQERVNLRRSLAETESIARHSREDFENQARPFSC